MAGELMGWESMNSNGTGLHMNRGDRSFEREIKFALNMRRNCDIMKESEKLYRGGGHGKEGKT